jgi:hypothetical protein
MGRMGGHDEEEAVAVTRERFDQGMTYDEFKAQLSRARDLYERNEQQLDQDKLDLSQFRGLPRYAVVVIVTETCPDVITNLPILDRIARESGNFEPRIFMRDDNRDLMAQFMNGPYESVPVFAFHDADFALRGVFIERPRSVTELRTKKTQELHATHPEFGPYGASAGELAENVRSRLREATQQMRDSTAGSYREATIRELASLITAMGQASPDSAPIWVGNLATLVPA